MSHPQEQADAAPGLPETVPFAPEDISCIAFDADDTLWHAERYFKLTQERFAARLAPHAQCADLDARLMAAERKNLGHYGFGVKGFVLSMIETALEITENRVPGQVIALGSGTFEC